MKTKDDANKKGKKSKRAYKKPTLIKYQRPHMVEAGPGPGGTITPVAP